MGKKVFIVIIVLLLIAVSAFVVFYFRDNIMNFIEDEGWIHVEPYVQKKVETANYYIPGQKLFVVRENNLNVYNKNLEVVAKENLNSSKLCYKTRGAYTTIASLDKHFIRLYKDTELLWNKETSLEIKSVSVNKNGYICVIFTQNGYRSGVKVFSLAGNEILNIYLASTYAVDAELSEDNKTLYIGEVDFNGINPKSIIKIVDVASNTSNTLKLGNDEIIVDIESSNGTTLAQSSEAIYQIDATNSLSTIYDLSLLNVKYVNIDSVAHPIVFDSDNKALRTIIVDEDVHLTIDGEPQLIDSAEDKIAIYYEDEVWILNNSLIVQKKCKIHNGLIGLEFYDNGRVLALIYNDKIELIKT